MSNLKYIGKNILNHDLILKKGDVSGSNASTGSFGNLNISSDASVTGNMVVGGRLTAQEIHTEIESASIIFTSGSTKFGDTSDDTHEFTGSILVKGNLTAENLTTDSSSVSTRLTTEEGNIDALQTDSSSFSTRTTTLEVASASFSTRITTAETELELTLISGSAQIATQISGAFDSVSSSLSSRLQTAETELENTLISASAQLSDQISGSFTAPSASFSTRITKNEGTGSKILAGQLNFTDITATGTVQAEQLTSTDDINATGIITSNERINIQATNARLSLGPNAASIGSPALHGGVIFQDSSISSAALGNISGFGATTSGNASNYYLLQLAGGSGMYMRVANNGAITFPSATSFTVPLITSTGDITANGNIVGDGATNIQAINHITASGNISGSSTSTGSFGLVLQNGNELSTFLGDRGTETLFSGSAASTGSFGNGEFAKTLRVGVTTPATRFSPIHLRGAGDQNGTAMATMLLEDTVGHGGIALNAPANKQTHLRFQSNGTLLWQVRMPQHDTTNPDSLRFYSYTHNNDVMTLKNNGNVGIGTKDPAERLDVVGNIQASGNISGSATSTASFGHFIGDGSGLENVFEGTAPSASISTRLTNLKTDSGSFSTRVTDLKTDSGSFSTRITNLKADSGSFSTRVTKNEGTGSKILNGQLEFTNITGSGHISMSLSSTGSFGRVSVTTLGGHSPIVIDANTTFIHSITSSAHVSSSMTSTASFGRVNVVALGGHQSLTIDPITTFTNVITASSAVQLDGKVFIQTGSIEGDLHVRTNENLMRIGKSTSGLIVSGSEQVSRFATGSDGSIIDLGFTVIDEDGGVVLAGDGDGIHIDSSNYWYNNKFYKVGDGSRHFLRYEPANGMRYRGEITVNTGSFGGEMFINSPTGSMFIGKFTGGIPSSGSGNISRFATGSDGSIIDLGFTTTDEEGETVFLTTGDGIVRDDKNYWYTTGHFKVGNGEKQIEWNTTDLNVSASTVDVTTLKASDVNFAGLPTSDPLVTGSLWISGSSSSGSYKSGFVMISGIHG